MSNVPASRIRSPNELPVNSQGEFVLYWMIANRRCRWNYSLQRAVQLATELKKPLVILEALRVQYRWASDRIHYFVIQGMADNARRLARGPALYYPYLEPETGSGKGLLAALARRSNAVISDDFPSFFLPRMIQSAAGQIPVRFELVDSNGMLPMRAAEKIYARAFDFRRFLQKNLPAYLDERPQPNPLQRARFPKLDKLPNQIEKKWPSASIEELGSNPRQMDEFPIDHGVPVSPIEGGARSAEKRLADFLADGLPNYESRNQPDQEVASGLSPYLHFGHISAHQVFAEVTASDDWKTSKISEKANGSAKEWWGASEPVESFLDELITWRELGYNMCWQRDDYDQYETLPDWAKKTLADHRRDRRPYVYSLEQFETAETHDELWNAAQRQLLQEGRIHNYLRMLWGKKILEWTAHPNNALDFMIELNNKYALDGRNPNSYSGIFWVLGRYDRAWGPERPIFGKVRYMSSENTARKVRVRGYIEKHSP